ncbi:MAG: thiamine phosphate synthase [Nautilia sp.]|nr:MAG: thiamine phosphate synthase [Nautilia sp.]
MIYALLDWELIQKFNISIESFINKCYQLDVKIIQYRDKNSDIKNIENRLKKIRKLWDKTLIINDYIDLIENADGLHIGQEDLEKYKSIENIRNKINSKILGLSTHNKEEILKANELDINYIGLGAYRPTNTKNVNSIGGEKLIKIAKLSKHPVAIIGGVKLSDKFDENIIKYKVIGSDICKSISTQ